MRELLACGLCAKGQLGEQIELRKTNVRIPERVGEIYKGKITIRIFKHSTRKKKIVYRFSRGRKQHPLFFFLSSDITFSEYH